MDNHRPNTHRRKLLAGAATLAAATPLVAGLAACQGSGEQEAKAAASGATGAAKPGANATATSRRKLGTLEASSVGLGVQNMSRTYQTTIPSRTEMHAIIRSAFDHGLTFYDAAEAYGPHEVERILIRGIETRFSPENLPHNLALVALIKTWAERKNSTPARIALAWLMAQKPWIVPIPGTTQMAHMLDNIGAAQITFGESELQELNTALAGISIRGERLPPAVQVFSGVEAPPMAATPYDRTK